MKKIWMILLALMVLTLVSCQGQASPIETTQIETTSPEQTSQTAETAVVDQTTTVYPLTYVDGFGREVIIEKEPQRVISLAPSITETVFALSLEKKLIGRTDWCVYPEGTASIESIGSLKEPNIESIVALDPDLVIASTHFSDDVLKKLEELQIKVVVITSQESFEGLYQTIGDVGLLLNGVQAADELVLDLRSRVETLLMNVKDLEKPTVYYAIAFGESGEYTAGGNTFISQMIEMAGGENIAKDIEGWTYSLEKLVESDPNIVIVSNKWDSKALFTEGENYKQLTAVKDNQVKEVDEDLVQIQGPRLVEGLEALVEAIHPELY